MVYCVLTSLVQLHRLSSATGSGCQNPFSFVRRAGEFPERSRLSLWWLIRRKQRLCGGMEMETSLRNCLAFWCGWIRGSNLSESKTQGVDDKLAIKVNFGFDKRGRRKPKDEED